MYHTDRIQYIWKWRDIWQNDYTGICMYIISSLPYVLVYLVYEAWVAYLEAWCHHFLNVCTPVKINVYEDDVLTQVCWWKSSQSCLTEQQEKAANPQNWDKWPDECVVDLESLRTFSSLLLNFWHDNYIS